MATVFVAHAYVKKILDLKREPGSESALKSQKVVNLVALDPITD